jgi:hypothetical protein
MTVRNAIFRLTLPASEVGAFLASCEAAQWFAFDTGERVTTDEGWDAEAILLVEPPTASPGPKARLGVAA